MSQKIFFDTYALIEIFKGNSFYEKFLDSQVITSKGNLLELYYQTLRTQGEQNADHLLSLYYPYVIEVDKEVIKLASQFKPLYRKKKLSYVDCIGYVIALQLNIPFLTGDKEFEDLPNVEFVK